MTSHLSRRVRALVDDVFALRADELGRQLDAIRCELDEPLRVLIAGRAKAGKSTLVNALLGRRVAPTGQLETTRVPAVFRFADREDAEVVLRSGERRPLGFQGDALPRETGVRDDRVALIDVRLSVRNGVLDALMLIDSPGTDTLTPAVARSADELLGIRSDGVTSRRAADAIVFVLGEELRREEVEVIRSLERSPATSASGATMLGVLTRADLVAGAGTSEEPLDRARRLADEHRHRCDGALSNVFPVMGLLAETADTAALEPRDLSALGALANYDDELTLRGALLSHERFRSAELPLEPGGRERLLERLDLFGIGDVVALLRRAPASEWSLRAVRDHLRGRSGFGPVRDALLHDFAERADAIKARRAIDGLVALMDDSSAGMSSERLRLSQGLEDLLSEPELHQLSVLEAWAAVHAGSTQLPQPLLPDLERMAFGATTAQRLGMDDDEDAGVVREEVFAAHRRWSEFVMAANPRAAVVGETMRMAYTLALSELDPQEVRV